MSKAGSEVILKSLLNLEIDIDALPMGEEERVPAGVETVILAPMVRPKAGHKVDIVEIKREEDGVERVVVGVEEGLEELSDDSDAGGFMVDA
jgi:DEAD/DEAH box helicase domain-containing protein